MFHLVESLHRLVVPPLLLENILIHFVIQIFLIECINIPHSLNVIFFPRNENHQLLSQVGITGGVGVGVGVGVFDCPTEVETARKQKIIKAHKLMCFMDGTCPGPERFGSFAKIQNNKTGPKSE